MDNTLQLLIKYTQKIIHESLNIQKVEKYFKKEGYILSKGNLSVKCKNKEQLIIDLLAEIYTQGKKENQQEIKKVLGI